MPLLPVCIVASPPSPPGKPRALAAATAFQPATVELQEPFPLVTKRKAMHPALARPPGEAYEGTLR